MKTLEQKRDETDLACELFNAHLKMCGLCSVSFENGAKLCQKGENLYHDFQNKYAQINPLIPKCSWCQNSGEPCACNDGVKA